MRHTIPQFEVELHEVTVTAQEGFGRGFTVRTEEESVEGHLSFGFKGDRGSRLFLTRVAIGNWQEDMIVGPFARHFVSGIKEDKRAERLVRGGYGTYSFRNNVQYEELET